MDAPTPLKIDAPVVESTLPAHTAIKQAIACYAEEFLKMDTEAGLTIVSVGSGRAHFEDTITQAFGKFSLICVDPTPASYRGPEGGEPKDVRIKPDYATVSDLLKHRKDLRGKCAVMLVRPTPHPESSYDSEALELLRPVCTLVIYQSDGMDGSAMLHKWLHSVGGAISNCAFDPMAVSKSTGMTAGLTEHAKTLKATSCYYAMEVPLPRGLAVPSVALLWAREKMREPVIPAELRGDLNPKPLTLQKCADLLMASMGASLKASLDVSLKALTPVQLAFLNAMVPHLMRNPEGLTMEQQMQLMMMVAMLSGLSGK
jgi:hypothetical protein